MRAIVKPWDEIKTDAWHHAKEYCGKLIHIHSTKAYEWIFKENWFYENGSGLGFSGKWLEIINEDEWDAEIYALLLLESEVIYE